MIDTWITNPFSSLFWNDYQRDNIEERLITFYVDEDNENALKLL